MANDWIEDGKKTQRRDVRGLGCNGIKDGITSNTESHLHSSRSPRTSLLSGSEISQAQKCEMPYHRAHDSESDSMLADGMVMQLQGTSHYRQTYSRGNVSNVYPC